MPKSALASFAGRLVVSVQADAGSPLRDVGHIRALAQCAVNGGAGGLRLQGADDIAAMRTLTGLPIIGLTKTLVPGSDVYITPRAGLALAVVGAGADIVAIDATRRARAEPFSQIAQAVLAAGAEVLADISDLDEARAAIADGATMVATTLAGYAGDAPEAAGPDFALMRALAAAGIPFLAEGRISSPEQARRALELGAHAVIVGSAITRPDVVTRWYADAVAAARISGAVRRSHPLGP